MGATGVEDPSEEDLGHAIERPQVVKLLGGSSSYRSQDFSPQPLESEQSASLVHIA